MVSREHFPSAGRLPATLEISHGPPGLLGRFFLWADNAVRNRGVTLHFTTFDELAAVNKANSDTWRPLFPIFDPVIGGANPQTGFAIIGRNANGEVVAAQGARIYDWSGTTLYDEAVSLRMLYQDADAARARGDKCAITAPSSKTISGRVAFSGAGWYRPDFRGKDLGTLLPRISRAYAFTRCETDYTISIMAAGVVAGGFADRCGYTKIAHDAVDALVTPMGVLRGALVWMETAELLSDIERLLAASNQPADTDGFAETMQAWARAAPL
jgi:hypothetical protein